MEDLLQEAVRHAEARGGEFADARFEDRRILSIRVVNDELHTLSRVTRAGVAVRARVGGAWGLGSTSDPTRENLAAAAEAAVKIARHGARSGPEGAALREPPTRSKRLDAGLAEHPDDVSLEDKLAFAFALCKSQKVADAVASNSSVYGERVFRQSLVNSFGASLDWEEVRTVIAGQAVAAEGDRREFSFNFEGGSRGYELVRGVAPETYGATIGEEAVELLGAAQAPGGRQTVVADPANSGLLAHEVMGHASEADEIVKARSFLTGMVGKRVGSALVTMYDDGTYPGGNGTIPFDSEGAPGHKTPVVVDGIYRGYLHSLETSGALDAAPTGNGRAQDFTRRVWVRMTNTYFAPGPDRYEEIIAETKDGVLASRSISGMEDPVGGGFEAVTLKGYRIEKGEITAPLRSFTLTGSALDILKTVDLVSREFELEGGMCGKGEEDWISVSSGGPYMRAQMVIGGG